MMSKRLENKNIIVTAAGQGIGRATAIAFSKQGAKVTATDLNEKTLASLNNEHKDIKIQKLDSTDYKAVKSFANSIQNVDVLFNAVGYVHHGTIMDCEEKDWDFSFKVNIKSMYFMIKSLIPKMIKQKKGNIINVTSIASSLKGLPNRFVYGSSKAAIIGLTKFSKLRVSGLKSDIFDDKSLIFPFLSKTAGFSLFLFPHLNSFIFFQVLF